MFTDVIRSTDNANVIYFLLTSYLEGMRYRRPPHQMPGHVTELPLHGLADVRRRFERLLLELDAASKRLDDKAVALFKQALHVFGTALDRLVVLDADKPTPHAAAGRVAPAIDSPAAAREPLDILLVEDNPADVRMTREALKVAGVPHHLHVVANGVDALSYLCRSRQYGRAPKPDVVLLDLNIPQLSGHEVLGEIKSRNNLRDIPVVVLTCSSAECDVYKSYGMRADHFVTKPTGLRDYVREMKKIEALAYH